MSGQHILASVRNRIGHLTLNRPEGLNALNLPMVRALQAHLRAWESDPSIVAVVLRAEGEKAFCAGGDIRMLHDSYCSGSDQHLVFLEEEYALDQHIHQYTKPILALVDGLILGGGMGLVQGAALRVITEHARLGMPEVAIGFFPDVGGSYFLSRLPGELGTYLGVTGLQVRAADALYAGLADWCISSSQIAELDHCLNKMSWSNTPLEELQALLSTLGVNRLPGSELKAQREVIDEHFAADDISALLTALRQEARPSHVDWAEEIYDLLASRSPMAMTATLELLRRGRQLELDECFAQELSLGREWFEAGDVIEGIRALMIDKDKTPRWRAASIADVEKAHVLGLIDCKPRSVQHTSSV